MPVLHFQDAVREHNEWWTAFKRFLYPDASAPAPHVEYLDIARDDLCAIGRWLHGDGVRFADHEAFKIVKDRHKTLHELSGLAWRAKTDGDFDVLESLTRDIEKIRHDLFMAWGALNDIVGAYD